MNLENHSEIIGRLTEIKQENKKHILIFSFVKNIEIPIDVFSKKNLESYIGSEIGILHIDDQYRIRRINEKLSDFSNE